MTAKVFQEHLVKNLIPFWNRMEDTENGGFYGYADSEGNPDKQHTKGCILNSRKGNHNRTAHTDESNGRN